MAKKTKKKGRKCGSCGKAGTGHNSRTCLETNKVSKRKTPPAHGKCWICKEWHRLNLLATSYRGFEQKPVYHIEDHFSSMDKSYLRIGAQRCPGSRLAVTKVWEEPGSPCLNEDWTEEENKKAGV